ncbi:MFS transporter, partial [Actinocorallia lasiicapitis]
MGAGVGRRQWAGVAVLMLPVLLVTIDNTVLGFVLPVLARELRPTAAEQLWIVDVYPLVLCTLLVAAGNLGDRIGRRRVLVTGAVGFGAASVVAACANGAGGLIVARVLMGVFGAALLPATHSLLRTLVPEREARRRAIAVWATAFAVGAAAGPFLGGVLVGWFGWRSVFLVGLVFVAPLVVLAPVVLPESRDGAPGALDLGSVVLSVGALAPSVYAVQRVAVEGIDGVGVVAGVLGAVCGVVLVRRLTGRDDPLLDVRLFRNPSFSGAIFVNLMSMTSLVGFLYFAAQQLQLVQGRSVLVAAVALVPGAVASVAAGLGVVRLVPRAGMGRLMAGGLLCSLAAYTLTAWVGADATLATVAGAYVLIGIGVGSAETLSNDLVLAAAPAEKAGAAAAVSETAYELGGVLGVAVLGSILTARYRAGLDLSAPGVHAVDRARETLGGAVDVAAG